ncbi:MAG: flavodoxin domain-containing protein [Thermodesulfobacteriota bacterium]
METRDIERWRISRRNFLLLAGGAICSSMLPYDMATASDTHQSTPEFIESTCEKEGKMKNRVLIAYASRHGSTGGVAEAIGQVLCETGVSVDVRLVGNVNDLSPYQAVIVGSAIRMRRWLPEAVDFVKKHQETLSRMPTAYFVVCLTMGNDTTENRRKVLAFLDPVRKQAAQIKPIDIGLFAGALDYKKLSFFYRLMFKVTGAPKGDSRNWEAIRTWATGLRPKLLGM